MEKFWIKIVVATGAVGVVSYLIFTLINSIFTDEMAEVLGDENLTYIIALLIFLLGFALILAILKSKAKTSQASNPTSQNKNINLSYGKESHHNGDNNF